MKISRSFQIQLVLFVATLAYSFYMASKMPDIVPTHWNASGHVDAYGSKWLNLLLMPGVLLFIAVLTKALPKLSPEQFKIDPFESTYSQVMVVISGLMVAMHVVIVEMSAGAKWDITRVMMAILFLSFIFVGNLMGKVQRNFYMGVRTPWTLSDERVWKGTHRFAAKCFVYGSCLGLLMVAVNINFWISFTYFMILTMAPIVQSYLLYKSLHGNGKPSAQE